MKSQNEKRLTPIKCPYCQAAPLVSEFRLGGIGGKSLLFKVACRRYDCPIIWEAIGTTYNKAVKEWNLLIKRLH